MRIMTLLKDGSFTVKEIVNMYYDDDITEIKDKNGNYNKRKGYPVEGLLMQDSDGDYLFIEKISKPECNRICKEVLEKGYADLSHYHYKYLSL